MIRPYNSSLSSCPLSHSIPNSDLCLSAFPSLSLSLSVSVCLSLPPSLSLSFFSLPLFVYLFLFFFVPLNSAISLVSPPPSFYKFTSIHQILFVALFSLAPQISFLLSSPTHPFGPQSIPCLLLSFISLPMVRDSIKHFSTLKSMSF